MGQINSKLEIPKNVSIMTILVFLELITLFCETKYTKNSALCIILLLHSHIKLKPLTYLPGATLPNSSLHIKTFIFSVFKF